MYQIFRMTLSEYVLKYVISTMVVKRSSQGHLKVESQKMMLNAVIICIHQALMEQIITRSVLFLVKNISRVNRSNIYIIYDCRFIHCCISNDVIPSMWFTDLIRSLACYLLSPMKTCFHRWHSSNISKTLMGTFSIYVYVSYLEFSRPYEVYSCRW